MSSPALLHPLAALGSSEAHPLAVGVPPWGSCRRVGHRWLHTHLQHPAGLQETEPPQQHSRAHQGCPSAAMGLEDVAFVQAVAVCMSTCR